MCSAGKVSTMPRQKGSKNIAKDMCSGVFLAVASGAKVGNVARVYGLPPSTVSNIISRRSQKPSEELTNARGNRPKLNAAGLLKLESVVKNNRFLPSHKLAANFYLQTYIEIAPRTVRRYISKLGFYSCSAAQKPFLRDANIAKRLVWADKHESYGEEDWKKVIYSDESSFAVRPIKNNIRVWRKRGERYNFSCTIPTFKSGREFVNVYGAFSATGRTQLVRIYGTLTKHVYQEILANFTLPFAFHTYTAAENFILQEDNASVHRAKTVEAYLNEYGVNRMVWPPQSPDLNPIENVWGLMKQKLRRRRTYPKNKDELFNILSDMWDALPQAYFEKLALGMHKRVAAVKKNEGKSTKY